MQTRMGKGQAGWRAVLLVKCSRLLDSVGSCGVAGGVVGGGDMVMTLAVLMGCGQLGGGKSYCGVCAQDPHVSHKFEFGQHFVGAVVATVIGFATTEAAGEANGPINGKPRIHHC